MVLVFPRPSHPNRLAAAFLGALLLSPLTASPASATATPFSPPGLNSAPSRSAPGHSSPGHGQPERLAPGGSPEVDRLYRKAARAAAQHERVRRAVDRQRVRTDRLASAAKRKRGEYEVLRRALGSAAATQYRGGVGPGARLVLARDPRDFLDRSASLRQGNRAGLRMVHDAHQARLALTERQRAAARALRVLRDRQREQARIKVRINAEIARAEQRAARNAAARQRVAQQLEAAGQGGSGAAPPSSPSVVRVSHQSGCPSGSSPGAPTSSASWVAPVGGGYTLTASFAAQGGRWAAGHTGQDFAVPTGTPVRSVGAGVVTRTGCGDSYGVQVVVRHDDGGYHTQYAHLSMLQVKAGQRVRAGQQIGLSGSTGNSSGPHLHFEVRVTDQSGSAISPVPWLRERGVKV